MNKRRKKDIKEMMKIIFLINNLGYVYFLQKHIGIIQNI